MATIKLYDAEISGNAYKIRLMLSLLDLAYERVPVDLAAQETRTAAFLKLNPRGQIPVLVDGDVVLWDSQAILVYLARQYAESWLPLATRELAEVMQWMAFAENEALFGLARARAAKLFGRPWNLAQCQTYGRAGLAVLERHLASVEWLATGRPTIADIACYPYVALAPEGDVSLEEHTNVRAWLARIQALDAYVGMPGIAGE